MIKQGQYDVRVIMTQFQYTCSDCKSAAVYAFVCNIHGEDDDLCSIANVMKK